MKKLNKEKECHKIGKAIDKLEMITPVRGDYHLFIHASPSKRRFGPCFISPRVRRNTMWVTGAEVGARLHWDSAEHHCLYPGFPSSSHCRQYGVAADPASVLWTSRPLHTAASSPCLWHLGSYFLDVTGPPHCRVSTLLVAPRPLHPGRHGPVSLPRHHLACGFRALPSGTLRRRLVTQRRDCYHSSASPYPVDGVATHLRRRARLACVRV